MYANLHTNAAKCNSVQAVVNTRVLKDQFIIIQFRLKDEDSSPVNIFRVGSGILITRRVSCLTIQKKSKVRVYHIQIGPTELEPEGCELQKKKHTQSNPIGIAVSYRQSVATGLTDDSLLM